MISWLSGVVPGVGIEIIILEVLFREVNENTAYEI